MASLRGKAVAAERARGSQTKTLVLSVRLLPFVLVGVSIGWMLAAVFSSRSLSYYKNVGSNSINAPAPTRAGLVHDIFSRQGLSHVAFHNAAFKERLAGLLRSSGVVAVVGVEYGQEVFQLARSGYEVYAFEALNKFVTRLNKVLQSSANRDWKVHLHHAAAGDTTGGTIKLTYSNENAVEMVPRARIDDKIPPGTEIDVLSVDIQGNEYDVLQGATKLLRGNRGIRSMWIEIGACKPKVYRMFDLLSAHYIIFDFVPWGLSKMTNTRVPAGTYNSEGWIAGRPAQHKEYLDWFCAEKKKHFTWLQSDVVAIRKDLITPQLLRKLAIIGNDAFVQYSEGMQKKQHPN